MMGRPISDTKNVSYDIGLRYFTIEESGIVSLNSVKNILRIKFILIEKLFLKIVKQTVILRYNIIRLLSFIFKFIFFHHFHFFYYNKSFSV